MANVSGQTAAMFVNRYRPDSPLRPENEKTCPAWRENTLEGYPERLDGLIVEINDPAASSPAGFAAIRAHETGGRRDRNVEYRNGSRPFVLFVITTIIK